jgi:Carboxypeptidase regulatory-like domain
LHFSQPTYLFTMRIFDFSRCFALFAMLFFACALQAQVTTSTIVGSVKSAEGEGLPGATVIATHTPSGTRYGTVTNNDGRFTLANLRVGGPYTVDFTMTGFQAQKAEGIQLSLGQKFALTQNMAETASALNEVVIEGDDAVLNNRRTGAANNIKREQIATLPTISRSAADFTRLSPQSDGNSFGGRNDQYNNFSLDGTIFNNPFGLDAATPGGQSDAQPVSLDAIDQIQIAYAPYDVSQSGFTGAAVNAVTKSGTNQVHGTAFVFGRNQKMVGKKVDGADAPRGDIKQIQTGFSIGGPIVKNKLFYFVNAEIERRSDLGSAFAANRGADGPGISRVLASDLDSVRAALKSIGYETGDYENFIFNSPNMKGIAKLDWNMATNHKLTVTYNFLNASKEKPANPNAIGRRGPDFTTLQFRNAGYQINNKINSFLAEYKATFGSLFANKFQVGTTSFRDSRDPFSTPAPSISIQKGGSRYIITGHEPFSIYNRLNQDVFQFNDNLNIYLGKHTVTAGVAFERFSFDNSFNLGTYGGTFGPDYASTEAFLDSVRNGVVKREIAGAQATADANALNENKWNWSYLNLGQASVYAQDEFAITQNFTVTAGVRFDKPLYFNTPELIRTKIDSSGTVCCYAPTALFTDENGDSIRFDHTVLPSSKPLVSPRIGFNWDVNGDGSTQIRGGTGAFTGRFPFVWIGNHVANPNFFFYNVTRPDFKYPQVWRSNLGIDQKFGSGFVGSLDVMFTKDENAMMVRNYSLGGAPTLTLNAPGDARKIYDSARRTQPTNNSYVFTNTKEGQSTNITLQMSRNWNGMSATLGYNFLDARDASSIEAEISSDAYDRNPAYGDVNQAVSAPSLYGNRHRVVGSFSKKFKYGDSDKFATTVGIFMQYAKGGRFSYTYSGDINNDGSGNNDLMFIPTDANIAAMKFDNTNPSLTVEAQRAALKSFIEQDEYLNANRGKVVEKYGILSPWYNNWDMRLLQDVGFLKGHGVQLSLDILNVGNLISNSWGVRQLPTNTQPLGLVTNKFGEVVLENGAPTYKFDTAIKSTFTQDFSLLSRWQMQLGLRYSF